MDGAQLDSRLLEANSAVTCLSQALSDGVGGLAHVPVWLETVLECEYWRERVRPGTGEVIKFDRFEDFVSEKVYWGLGSTVQQLKNLLRDNPKLIDLMDKAMQRTAADNEPVNIINGSTRPQGTTAAAAIRRLRKDRPDLHAKVIAGELSAHAAAIEAGFRKRTVTLPADPPSLADTIIRRYPEAAKIIADKFHA